MEKAIFCLISLLSGVIKEALVSFSFFLHSHTIKIKSISMNEFYLVIILTLSLVGNWNINELFQWRLSQPPSVNREQCARPFHGSVYELIKAKRKFLTILFRIILVLGLESTGIFHYEFNSSVKLDTKKNKLWLSKYWHLARVNTWKSFFLLFKAHVMSYSNNTEKGHDEIFYFPKNFHSRKQANEMRKSCIEWILMFFFSFLRTPVKKSFFVSI